jgi:hypothetical protein
MNAKLCSALFGLSLALATPAMADYLISTPTVAPPTATLQVVKAGTVVGGIQNWFMPVDAANNPFATATNPLAITFGTGALLPQFASPAHFICDSGCAGGGGSSYTVTFGGVIGTLGTPNGYKDGSGNFQPILGDVTNGQWVSVKASVPLAVTGTFFQATQPVSIASPVAITGTFWPYTLGQQLAGASVPVVLTAAQLTTLTPPTSVGISGTLPAYAATPTFNFGTLNGAATAANQTSVIGPVAAGAAAASSLLVGGQYNSSPITLTTTQQSALQLDANGFLKVNVSAGAAAGGTSSSFSAAFPATGTAAGMSQGGNMVSLTGTAGNLNVQCANCSGSGASAVDGAAFTVSSSVFAPAGGVFNDGLSALSSGTQAMARLTSFRAEHVNLRDNSGVAIGVAAAPLQVSLANTAANGTALLVTGTGGTFPITAASLPLPTGAATSANQPTNAALASTTAGQTGHLMLGAVTTGAPAYTTAQSNALSLTTAGALRVDGSAVTQPVSLTSTTITGTVAVTQSGSWSLSANQSVNVAQINGVTPLMGNGVTGTGSPRVTIASDNTAFSVNATLAAETTKVIGTVRNLGNAGAITDFAGQNAASPANAWLIGGQFQTTPTTITPGNSSPLQLDNAGNLLVNIKAGASSGAVAQGSTTSGQTGGLVQCAVTTSAPTYTTATTNPLSCDTAGNFRVTVTSALGLAAGSTTSGQTGSMIMGAVTTAAPSYTTAQTNYLSLTTAGAARSDIASVNGTTALTGGVAGSLGIGGLAANGASASGNPVPAGAVAQTSEAVVTAGQAAALVTDLARKLIVLPYANPENFVSGSVTTAMTGTTSTSLIAAPAAGLRNYITSCTFSNEHATVGTSMILQDGSGGTTIWTAPAAAVYGGAQLSWPTPLRQPTTATALFVQNVTTGASTKASCSGYKGA